MQQLSSDNENVYWKQVQGNKLNKALHPAMLSEHGYRTTSKIRLVGTTRHGSKFAILIYDREYVIVWIMSKLIKPFQNIGLDGLIELLKEAWHSLHESQGYQSSVWENEDEQV
jgi:hypothetical protein